MHARFYTSYEAYPAAAGASNLPRTSPPAQRAHQRHHVRYAPARLPARRDADRGILNSRARGLDFLTGRPDGWVLVPRPSSSRARSETLRGA